MRKGGNGDQAEMAKTRGGRRRGEERRGEERGGGSAVDGAKHGAAAAAAVDQRSRVGLDWVVNTHQGG